MKIKRLNKKLVLTKSTIVDLSGDKLNRVKGGIDDPTAIKSLKDPQPTLNCCGGTGGSLPPNACCPIT